MSIIEVERDEVEDILAELDGYDCTSNLNPGSSRDGFIPAKGSSALQFALKQVRDGASKLDLSHWSIRLGIQGSIALAELLRRPKLNLTTILLNCNEIGPKGSAALSEALKDNFTVTRLDLSSNNILDAGASSIADFLKVSTVLKYLELEDNGIGPPGAIVLAQSLKVNRALESLHLGDNVLTDLGATCLADCLSANTALQTLWLAGNKIGNAGAGALSSSLANNTSLKTLYLGSPRPVKSDVLTPVDTVASIEEFEEKVLKSNAVTLILITMGKSDDESKMKGVDREECSRAEGLMSEVKKELSPYGIEVYTGDYDNLGPIASEFHVRKRMLPVALIFNTRARNGGFIKITDASFVKEHVLELLKENNNPKTEDGKFSKITLQLGGGDL